MPNRLSGSFDYFQFRRQVAKFALSEMVRLVKTGAPYVIGILGVALMGLVALLCLPMLYACTQSMRDAMLMIAAQSVIVAAPAWLQSKWVLPVDVVTFFRPLPVAGVNHLKADASVAWMMLQPLAVMYVISMGIWLWQFPDWIHAIWLAGIFATIASFATTWLLVILRLQLRWHRWQQLFGKKPCINCNISPTSRFFRQFITSPHLLLCHDVLWLPLWRKDSGIIGRRQILLLISTLIAVCLWINPFIAQGSTRVWLSIIASTLLITMTSLANTALLRNLTLFSQALASLPFSMHQLKRAAKLLAMMPAMLVISVFFIAVLQIESIKISLKMASIYTALSIIFVIAISGFTQPNTTVRVATVILSSMMLSVIGSELWQ